MLSRCTTPDCFSYQGSDDGDQTNQGKKDLRTITEIVEEGENAGVHLAVKFRKRREPQQLPDKKTKFDRFLTQTKLRAIDHSNNQIRWKKIIEKDLYSKTPGRGLPVMRRN